MATKNFAGTGAPEVRRGERKSGPREGAAYRQEVPAAGLRRSSSTPAAGGVPGGHRERPVRSRQKGDTIPIGERRFSPTRFYPQCSREKSLKSSTVVSSRETADRILYVRIESYTLGAVDYGTGQACLSLFTS